MEDTARSGQQSTDRMEAQQDRLAGSHRRVADAQDNTTRSTRVNEAAQSRLASTVRRGSGNISADFSKIGKAAQQASQSGMVFTRGFGAALGGMAAITPAAGAAGSALIAGAGNAVTFAASLSSLGGVAALIPAGLMAIGAGAGTLITAFSGIGDALKEVNKVQSEAPTRNPRLDAMAVEDASQAIIVAEENAAQVQVDSARRVADAKRNLQDVIVQVAEAQKAALKAVDMAERDEAKTARDVTTAQKDLAAAREEAASQIKKVAHDLNAANLQAVDTAIAYKKAVIEYKKAQADPTTLGSDLDQLQNNVAKTLAANEDAKQQVIDLKGEQKKAQQEAKTGSDKVLAAEQRLTDARQAQADAVQARKDAQADVVKQEVAGARQIADAQQAIRDATVQGARAQKDAARSVEQANRNLERVQMQQADAATKAGAAAKSAMDKLTPSAREAVITLLAVKGMLEQVRDVAQENFFKGFSAPLMSLAKTVIPQLITGVGAIASQLGAGARIFMGAVQDALGNGVLESLLKGVADTTGVLNQVIRPVVRAFTTLGVVGMRYMPRLARFIVTIAEQFNDFIQGVASNGKLGAWIEDGIQSLKDLWSIGGSVIGIFMSMDRAAKAGGAAATLGGMATALSDMDKVMQGSRFQTTMTTLFEGASDSVGHVLDGIKRLGPAIEAAAPTIAGALDTAGKTVETVIGYIADILSDPQVLSGVKTFVDGVQTAVEDLKPAIGPISDILGGLLTFLGELLPPIAQLIATVAKNLGPVFGRLLDALKPLVKPLQDLVTAFVTNLAPVFDTFAHDVLPKLVTLFKDLKPGIDGVFKLFTVVAEQLMQGIADQMDRFSPILQSINQFAGPAADSIGNVLDKMQEYKDFKWPEVSKNPNAPKAGPFLDLALQFSMALTQTTGPTGRAVSRWFTTVTEGFRHNFGVFMDSIAGFMNPQELAGKIVGFFSDAAKNLSGTASQLMSGSATGIASSFIGGFSGLNETVKAIWDGIAAAAVGAVTFVAGWVRAKIQWLQGVWGAVWTAIRNKAAAIWAGISSTVTGVFTFVGAWVQSKLLWLQSMWAAGWGVLRAKASEVWGVISSVIRSIFTSVTGWVQSRLSWLQGIWATVWGALRTKVSDTWGAMGGTIKNAWDRTLKPVFDKLHDVIFKTLPDAFNKGVGFIKTHWDKLRDVAKAPVKFVIDTVLNKGLIGGFNQIADFLKIGKITPIDLGKGWRDGGYTGDLPTGAVAGVVHGDEHVIRSESRRKVERTHPGLLDHLNRTGNVAGYRDGGRVAPLKHMALTQGWNHVHKGIDLAASVGTPVFATEAGRVSWAGPGVSAPGVWGGQEIHIDGGSGVQEWFAHMSQIGVRLGQMVRAGQQIGLSGNTGITSGPHLHFGTFAGGWPNDINPLDYLGGAGVPSGGTGGGGFNPIAGIIDGLLSKFKDAFPAGGAFLDMVIGVGKKIMDGASEWVTKTLGGGDKKGNAAGMVPTVYDGGGWLHNTGGPQLIDHRKSKPDAVLTYEELQMFKAAAKNNLAGGVNYSPTYQYMGEDPETVMRKDKARAMDLLNALV